MQKIIELGIKTPKDLTGKNIFFDVVKVRNPSTGEQVDSLVINKVQ